jgi:hypothetical protein
MSQLPASLRFSSLHVGNTSYQSVSAGLTKEVLDQHGIPFEQAIAQLKQALPKTAILVGQNIGQDVAWLGLREGVDFAGLMGESQDVCHYTQSACNPLRLFCVFLLPAHPHVYDVNYCVSLSGCRLSWLVQSL